MNKVAIADISHVGLCLDCEYAKHVKAKEDTVYFLCHRFFTDPTFRCLRFVDNMNHAQKITIALVLNCFCGILVGRICIVTDGAVWGGISALILGVSSAIFVNEGTILKACMFVVGEAFSTFIPGRPFAAAGFVVVWLLPLLGIFILGSRAGKAWAVHPKSD